MDFHINFHAGVSDIIYTREGGGVIKIIQRTDRERGNVGVLFQFRQTIKNNERNPLNL